MRTPLDAFHAALLDLVDQKRGAEIKKKPRRTPAVIYEGERVIYFPPRNLPEGQRALADGTYGKRALIEGVGGSQAAAVIRFDHISGMQQVVDRRWLDAEPLLDEDVDAAIASIRSLLEKP